LWTPAISRAMCFLSDTNPAADTAANRSRLSAKCLYGAL
jgi:hypothetical protein